MTDTTVPETDDAVLAGELALRVLEPLDEARARARAEADPAFAAEVEAWNDRLAAFVSEIAPVEPSPGVWPRIAEGLGGAANDNDGRLAFWKTWAIGTTALLVASLGAVAFMAGRPPEVVTVPGEPVAAEGGVTRVATLTLESGATAVTLAYDTATGGLFLMPSPELAVQDGVPHLWLVQPEGGVRLVGAIDDTEASRRELDAALTGIAGNATAMAISLEPEGQTPASDTPAGPVVASGELQRL